MMGDGAYFTVLREASLATSFSSTTFCYMRENVSNS